MCTAATVFLQTRLSTLNLAICVYSNVSVWNTVCLFNYTFFCGHILRFQHSSRFECGLCCRSICIFQSYCWSQAHTTELNHSNCFPVHSKLSVRAAVSIWEGLKSKSLKDTWIWIWLKLMLTTKNKTKKKNNHDIFLTLAPKSLNKLQKTEAITDEGTLKYCTVADIA